MEFQLLPDSFPAAGKPLRTCIVSLLLPTLRHPGPDFQHKQSPGISSQGCKQKATVKDLVFTWISRPLGAAHWLVLFLPGVQEEQEGSIPDVIVRMVTEAIRCEPCMGWMEQWMEQWHHTGLR